MVCSSRQFQFLFDFRPGDARFVAVRFPGAFDDAGVLNVLDGFLHLAEQGAGYFSAAIPGQAAGALVAFWISAEDDFSPSATASFPNDAPQRACLVRFGETQPAGTPQRYHRVLRLD